MDINLSEIDLEQIGSWPTPVKLLVISLTVLLLLGLGYWFDTQGQIDTLKSHQNTEQELRQEMELKQRQAVNLPAYRLQLFKMQRMFGEMLSQLPNKTEVPGLLEDISDAGVSSGLEFKLFAPSKEIEHDFYAELPIKIIVVGNYHQLGSFVARVASLNRIVTLHDFQITRFKKQDVVKPPPGSPASVETSEPLTDKLVMDITAKIYRYNDGVSGKAEDSKESQDLQSTEGSKGTEG